MWPAVRVGLPATEIHWPMVTDNVVFAMDLWTRQDFAAEVMDTTRDVPKIWRNRWLWMDFRRVMLVYTWLMLLQETKVRFVALYLCLNVACPISLLRGRYRLSIGLDSKLVHNLIRRSGTRCKCQFSDIISICNRKPVKRPIFGHFYFEQKSLYLYFLLCSGSGRILHDTFFGQKFVKILEIVIFMTKNMVFWS